MKKTGKKLFVFFAAFAVVLICSFGWAAGQVKLDATVDQNEVAVGDNITLTITLTSDQNINDDEEPRLPTLDGFELLNKWTQSEASSVFENGKFSFIRKQVYKYNLTPEKAGNLEIGAAEIHVNGQALSSSPIKIKVLAAGSPGAKSKTAQNQRNRQQQQDEDAMGNPVGGSPDDDDDDIFNQLLKRRGLIPDRRGGVKSVPQQDSHEAFFVTVEANKKKVYVGEEIVVSWYFYTRGAVQAFDALKYPDLKGFWKEDLEMATRLNFSQDVVNGVPYNKALLVSYALFPISAGQKNIDSYKVKATVVQLDNGLSMFGIGHPYTYVKASKELPLEVIPLPTEGRPASFSGAVGHFNITGSLSATQVKVNQPVSLKIRFSGEGNVKAIDLPPLDLPKNLEVYDTKKDSQFNKDGQGYKEFEVLLIPRSQGELTIPPISVSYFDPKTAKYVSQQTPSFSLKVLAGEGGGSTQFNSPLTQTENSNPSKDIHYLKTTPSFQISPAAEAWGWVVIFILVYAWFGWQIFGIVIGRDLDGKNLLRKRVKMKLKAALLKLKAGDWRAVGIESSNAVMSTLSEVSGVGGVSHTVEEMMAALPTHSIDLQNRVQKFLSRCEILSFAPKEMADQFQATGGADLKNLVSEAEKIISDLFELAKREKSSTLANASEAGQRTS